MTACPFFQGRKVLITGLTGFKGVWLGLWLRGLGADVQGLALPPTEEMLRGWPDIEHRLPCDRGDIRDFETVERVFRQFRPEIVFHMAAQPLVRLSYEDPIGTFTANVTGTVHVLEAARRTPSVKAAVVVTSDKCYENREWHWGYREGESLGGHDPYSASKACAEIVTASYRQSFGEAACLKIASARAGNVVGGGDWAKDRLVPDIVRAVLSDRPVVLRCPDAQRPWQHVLEPLSGYLLLGKALIQWGEPAAAAWNFGPVDEEPLTVGEVTREIVRTWGRGEVIEEAALTGPHEAKYLKLDSSKAIAELGWRPLLSPVERFHWTVEWYQAWQADSESAWRCAERQIEAMQRRIAANKVFARQWFSEQAERRSVVPQAA